MPLPSSLPLLQLHIEVNGDPLGDSPYPIFFSAPVPVPLPAPGAPAAAAVPGAAPPAMALGPGGMPLPTMTAGGFQVVTAASIKEAQAAQAAAVAAVAQTGGAVNPALAAAAGTTALAAAYPNIGTGMQVSLVGAAANYLPAAAGMGVLISGLGLDANL